MKSAKNENKSAKTHCCNPATSTCENEAFVWDLPQKVKVEDVKTKLSCETSLKKWKLKMWTRSFPARLPSKTESWWCENEAFVRLLCCVTSLLWGVFAMWLLCYEISLLWGLFAVGLFAVWLLCCVTSLLCDCCEKLLCCVTAVRLLCCGASLPCDFFAVGLLCCVTAVRLLGCEACLPCDFFAVRRLCCVTFLMWDFNDFQRSVTRTLDFQTSLGYTRIFKVDR